MREEEAEAERSYLRNIGTLAGSIKGIMLAAFFLEDVKLEDIQYEKYSELKAKS